VSTQWSERFTRVGFALSLNPPADHPNDQVASTDSDRFSIDGVRAVEGRKTAVPLVPPRSAPYDAIEFVAGAMIAAAFRFRQHGWATSSAAWVGGMPRRKVRTPQGAMVGNAHRSGPRGAARIGTVPQKIDRLRRNARVTAEVRVKR
jgi:hypothetical protein